MKIAFILPGNGRSGGVRCTVTSANLLIQKGHKVRIFYKKQGLRKRIKEYLTIENRQNSDWLPEFNGQTIPFSHIHNCSFQKGELIVGVGMWSSAQISTLSDSNPKLQYIHGLTPWAPDLMKTVIDTPISKIFVSTNDARYFEENNSQYLLGVVPNGIDLNNYFTEKNVEKNGWGLIYYDHNEAKDPKTIEAVIKQLTVKYNLPVNCFGTSKRPSILNSKQYTRYPSIDTCRKLYSQSEIWFLLSKSEGFPAPPLEAMACGCCVISTKCGGIRDIINNGKNGYLVEVGNVNQIIEKFDYLLSNKDICTQIQRRALETVKEFSWEKHIIKLEELLLKAI